jgi:phage N-6-adenine-methyltransferase
MIEEVVTGVRARVMPPQKPHRSIQVVSTPWALIDYVESRWGKLTWDLAATAGNCKVRFPGFEKTVNRDARYGPGAPFEDALRMNWGRKKGTLWLNPEFGNIAPFAEHSAETQLHPNSRIVMLVPAAVGTLWWANFVDKKADVEFIRPRVVFRKHKQGYVKDLALCVYNHLRTHSYSCARWDGKKDKS